MPAIITSETLFDTGTPPAPLTIEPEFVMPISSARELRTIAISVPGSSEPYIAYELSGLRTGELQLFMRDDEAAAIAAEDLLAAGTTFSMQYPERPTWEMRFVPVGTLTRRQDEADPNLWTITVGFQELAP